jgi:hypothetical protein
MKKYLLLVFLTLSSFLSLKSQPETINGAWKDADGVLIITGNYFAYTAYTPTEFKYTYGGSCRVNAKEIELTYEFHTNDKGKVGQTEVYNISVDGKTLSLGEGTLEQIDDGTPGKLSGAWLFANRKRDGQLGEPRNADNPRKTLKILSGTRFQWIAYNTETGEFFGTGGGTYSTVDGKYTENIDFFSRDDSRVGASLIFDFDLQGDEWHHQGLSSRGDPIYEIWNRRE